MQCCRCLAQSLCPRVRLRWYCANCMRACTRARCPPNSIAQPEVSQAAARCGSLPAAQFFPIKCFFHCNDRLAFSVDSAWLLTSPALSAPGKAASSALLVRICVSPRRPEDVVIPFLAPGNLWFDVTETPEAGARADALLRFDTLTWMASAAQNGACTCSRSRVQICSLYLQAWECWQVGSAFLASRHHRLFRQNSHLPMLESLGFSQKIHFWAASICPCKNCHEQRLWAVGRCSGWWRCWVCCGAMARARCCRAPPCPRRTSP